MITSGTLVLPSGTVGVESDRVDASAAADGFGWLGSLATIDAPASSAVTQQLLGWQPTHVGLLDDLRTGDFFDFSS